MNRLWLALLLAVAACGLNPAFAEVYVPGLANWRVARFPSLPASVTVDVMDITLGTQPGNNIATTRVQVDAADSDAFKYNLATVTGYPTTCTPKVYLLQFRPNTTADCNATPSGCVEETVYVGGPECFDESNARDEQVYTSESIDAQGITKTVLEYYKRRGERVPKWRKTIVAYDGDFASPDETRWKVFFYSSSATSAASPYRCGPVVKTDPAAMTAEQIAALANGCAD
jgi:hypothetical protein